MFATGFFWILIFFLPYGLIHSWMASLSFKAALEKRWPAAYRRYYRIFYNIFSVVTFLPVIYLDLVLPDIEIYSFLSPWSILLRLVQLAALILFVLALFQTNLLSFVGLRQVIGETSKPEKEDLVTGGFYGLVRHPLYLFGLLVIWFSPSLSYNGLGLNLGATLYILIGMYFEERKLLREFGEQYARYRQSVPALIPFTRPRR